MTKNPFYNAVGAATYIVLIVSVMNLVTKYGPAEDSLIMPIMVLSLFTLSTAVMGYIFCYQPLRLFLEDKKDKAASLFLKTVAIFAGITFGIVAIYFVVAGLL